MNLNLVFKKEVVSPDTPGGKRVLMKIVPVNVDGVDESWHLASCAHGVEFCKQEIEHAVAVTPENIVPVTVLGPTLTAENTSATVEEQTSQEPELPKEYISPIQGTACLIRKGSLILIAYRRGKNKDKNTLNRVCVDDVTKQRFFNHCKEAHGAQYSFTDKEKAYEYWNKFMDDEFHRQAKMVMQQ